MDQLKEFLRQAVKHRFWIAVGVSALLPLIAYFTASGAIKAKALAAETKVKSAHSDVQKYRSPGLPNDQYKPIADQKIDALTQDVNKAWRQLYARQAPLLTWPENIQEYFRRWGRMWPENVDPNLVQNVILDYVNTYPAYVDQVYNSFSPWKAGDLSQIDVSSSGLTKEEQQTKFEALKKEAEAGTGLVAAPPKEALLKPSVFNTTTPPTLGQVWEAQEKLWVQGALLDVIANVNAKAKAKDWESAPVKQITGLEIGSETAQDQQSLAAGEALVEPEDLLQPGAEAPVEADPSLSGGSMMGGEGMSGSGMVAGKSDRIRFIKPNDQYRVYPVSLSVLIDQNYVQDLLVAFQNSPMSIQAKDFELQRPKTRVTKPQQGQTLSFGEMGGYSGGMSSSYGMSSAYGPSSMMSSSGMMPYGMSSSMGMPGSGMTAPLARGKDIRDLSKVKTRDGLPKGTAAPTKVEIYDPYYSVVEVHIYGQARFYNPPPPEEPAPTSEDSATAAGAAEAPPESEPASPQPAPDAAPAPAETPQPSPGSDTAAPKQ